MSRGYFWTIGLVVHRCHPGSYGVIRRCPSSSATRGHPVSSGVIRQGEQPVSSGVIQCHPRSFSIIHHPVPSGSSSNSTSGLQAHSELCTKHSAAGGIPPKLTDLKGITYIVREKQFTVPVSVKSELTNDIVTMCATDIRSISLPCCSHYRHYLTKRGHVGDRSL